MGIVSTILQVLLIFLFLLLVILNLVSLEFWNRLMQKVLIWKLREVDVGDGFNEVDELFPVILIFKNVSGIGSHRSNCT